MVRATGAMLYSSGNLRYGVARVFADTPAARFGPKPGDTLMAENPDGGVRAPAQGLDAIRTGQRVRVARKINQVRIDIDLPDDPLLQQSGS